MDRSVYEAVAKWEWNPSVVKTMKLNATLQATLQLTTETIYCSWLLSPLQKCRMLKWTQNLLNRVRKPKIHWFLLLKCEYLVVFYWISLDFGHMVGQHVMFQGVNLDLKNLKCIFCHFIAKGNKSISWEHILIILIDNENHY